MIQAPKPASGVRATKILEASLDVVKEGAHEVVVQWGRGAGGMSVTPEPKIPFGATPSRTRNARLPGSMFLCRPHDQLVSK